MDKPQEPKPKTAEGRSRFVALTAWKGQPLYVDPVYVQGVLQSSESEAAAYVYLANGQSPQVAMSAADVLRALEGKG